MSNIEIGNIKKSFKNRPFNTLKMNKKNYMGTYYFTLRQTINYDRKSDGKESNKYILIISNPEGNYIDYIKGRRSDINKIDFGKRCVFQKGNTIITGKGSEPSSVLTSLKIRAISYILLKLMVYIMIIYFIYEYLLSKFL